MNAEHVSTVANPAAKALSLWAAVGLTSWTDVAALLAALYSLILIGEWIWKKWVRPGLECRGVIDRLKRRAEDDE